MSRPALLVSAALVWVIGFAASAALYLRTRATPPAPVGEPYVLPRAPDPTPVPTFELEVPTVIVVARSPRRTPPRPVIATGTEEAPREPTCGPWRALWQGPIDQRVRVCE